MQHYVAGIPSKQVDILLDPFQSLALIEQASIEVTVPSHFLRSQEAISTDPIVDIDHYDAMVRRSYDFVSVVVCIEQA